MRKMLIFMLCLVGVCLFSQGIPYGQEFRVNPSAEGSQWYPSIAALTQGGFVICWVGPGLDGSGTGVYGQIYNASGERINGIFRVDTITEKQQQVVAVTALSGGGFVVCWQRLGPDIYNSFICGQVFNASGGKRNSEFQVNTDTGFGPGGPSLTALSGGGFVVCWDSYTELGISVFGQIFNEDGEKKKGEFRVNPYTDTDQSFPKVTALYGGGFVVCWVGNASMGNMTNSVICGQIFDESGEKTKSEFMVNSIMSYHPLFPSVAALLRGGFIVCWNSYIQSNYEYKNVYGQLFDESADKKNSEFRVNTKTGSDSFYPSIAVLAGGGFCVCYDIWKQNGSLGKIYMQLFNESGEKKNHEFQVNNYIKGYSVASAIAALVGGGFVVCWSNEMDYYGSKVGIYAKRFPASPLLHKLKQFNLNRPENDATLMTTDTCLVWRQASDEWICYPRELHYRVFIADNPDFLSPEIKELDQDTTVTLSELRPGTTYFWKVLARNIPGDSVWSTNTNAFFVAQDATSGVETEQAAIPKDFMLHQNYPNPFNSETMIRFELPASGIVDISIYDVSGKLVRVLVRESRQAGSYSVKWDGRDSAGNAVPSGIYICRMETRSSDGRRFTQSVKMGLVR
jgi:hypothetical protein